MKLTISRKSARTAALVSITARLFLGLAVDAPPTQNGAWLCALFGALLAAPWMLCLRLLVGIARKHRLLYALLGLLALIDGAHLLSVIARSAGYLALDRLPELMLLLPAGLALVWCVLRNGDAVGYAAMVWVRVAVPMLLLVAALQWRYYRPDWLCPLLGEGSGAILGGSVRAAGWIIPASGALALVDDGDQGAGMGLGALALSAVTCAALLTLRLMMAPTQREGWGWLLRLDSLLCNGRAPLYLQLPMIAIWFAGLLHLATCELFAASALLQRVVPEIEGRICAMLAVGTALVISRVRGFNTWSLALSRWSFAAVATLTLIALLSARRKGGHRACGSAC